MGALESLSPGTAADAVDGVVPGLIGDPATPEALAQLLADAARARRTTVIRGGGSKLTWGRVPPTVDLLLRTSSLDRLVAHRHGDLTVTAQAGMPLARLNQMLGQHGQYLPIDTAFEQTTVGGLIATNDSGPLRYRHGTPRDLLIGITLAMADGRLVKAGGTVVKNVAGYDLGKLVTGSFGGLAAIVDATFKLLPLPRASATVVASYTDPAVLARDAAAVVASQIEPTAFDVRVSRPTGGQLLLRLASSPASTEAQVREVRGRLSSETVVLNGESERAAWLEQVQMPWVDTGTVVRLSWLPSSLEAVIARMGTIGQGACGPTVFTGRVSGAGFLRLQGDIDAQRAVVDDLRQWEEIGHVVLLRAPRALKTQIDVWGPETGASSATRALKQMFDPMGILNAGRGPV